jgi:hypothetical protein
VSLVLQRYEDSLRYGVSHKVARNPCNANTLTLGL